MGILMGRLEEELRHVEEDVAVAVRRYHLRQQVLRLAAGVAGAVVLSLTRGGLGPLDWKAALPVAAAAALAYLRSQVPTVPWAMLGRWLGLPPVDAGGASAVRAAPSSPFGVSGTGTVASLGQSATVLDTPRSPSPPSSNG